MKNSANKIKVELLISSAEGKELAELLSRIGEEKLSKDQAMRYVNCNSQRTFDRLVARGRLPKGRKQRGFKELYWLRSEISEYIKNKQ